MPDYPQEKIDELVNRTMLRHAVFYGQNDITRLLEVRCSCSLSDACSARSQCVILCVGCGRANGGNRVGRNSSKKTTLVRHGKHML